MIRVGLLGASKIAPKAIIRPVQSHKNFCIQAVASRSAERARSYADEHGIPHFETSYAALIARDDIDLIYNALPPSLHCDLTVLAAEHGKHILCEKPFAMNAEEAQRMIEAAAAAKVVLIEAFHYRFHPAFLKFEKIVKSGKLGQIENISGIFDVHIPNRDGELRYIESLGGGALMDLGCYPLHAMRTLTGHEPKLIEAVHHMDEAGLAVATWASLQFGNIMASLQSNMGRDAIYQNSIHVVGSKGVAKIDGFVHPYRWDPFVGFEIYVEVGGVRERTSLLNSPESWKRSTYAYQLEHVFDVLTNSARALTGGQDSVATMAAIDSILSV